MPLPPCPQCGSPAGPLFINSLCARCLATAADLQTQLAAAHPQTPPPPDPPATTTGTADPARSSRPVNRNRQLRRRNLLLVILTAATILFCGAQRETRTMHAEAASTFATETWKFGLVPDIGSIPGPWRTETRHFQPAAGYDTRIQWLSTSMAAGMSALAALAAFVAAVEAERRQPLQQGGPEPVFLLPMLRQEDSGPPILHKANFARALLLLVCAGLLLSCLMGMVLQSLLGGSGPLLLTMSLTSVMLIAGFLPALLRPASLRLHRASRLPSPAVATPASYRTLLALLIGVAAILGYALVHRTNPRLPATAPQPLSAEVTKRPTLPTFPGVFTTEGQHILTPRATLTIDRPDVSAGLPGQRGFSLRTVNPDGTSSTIGHSPLSQGHEPFFATFDAPTGILWLGSPTVIGFLPLEPSAEYKAWHHWTSIPPEIEGTLPPAVRLLLETWYQPTPAADRE